MMYFIASSSSLSDRHALRRTTSREIDNSPNEVLCRPGTAKRNRGARPGRRIDPDAALIGRNRVIAPTMATVTSVPAWPGAPLEGRYRLDDRIGAGGMGEVWRATDLVLDRLGAGKLLDPGGGGREGGPARFPGG